MVTLPPTVRTDLPLISSISSLVVSSRWDTCCFPSHSVCLLFFCGFDLGMLAMLCCVDNVLPYRDESFQAMAAIATCSATLRVLALPHIKHSVGQGTHTHEHIYINPHHMFVCKPIVLVQQRASRQARSTHT